MDVLIYIYAKYMNCRSYSYSQILSYVRKPIKTRLIFPLNVSVITFFRLSKFE